MSSHSQGARKKNRLAWLIPALVTLLLFFGGVSLEILSDDLKEMTKPYRKLVWTVFITSALIAIFMGIREWRKSDDESEAPQPPAPPVMNSLHPLPSSPRGFVGRKKEIKELTKALEKSGVTILGLHGLGGVGKTALAKKLAEQLKPHYPDAQFYLDLKGASPQPLSASKAMAHVIRAYYPTAKLPKDESALRGLYCSVLEGKRALLLMDNAASRQQIEPLVPPDSCVLLVTSRNHFTMNGLFAKNLDTLEPKDARDLLLKIAPRIGKCADEMAKLCGYLPLALELAASALSVSVNYTPEEYLQKLSKTKERLGLVEASLGLSYDLLKEDMQSLWRRLAVFPNTFDNAAAAAVWKIEIDDAQDRLTKSIAFSLVEWDETSRRYRLHDLVRLFADSRMSEIECYAAKKLHATHYRNVLAQAENLYLEGGEKVKKGLTLFDLERENIDVGQDWAASFIDKENDVTQLSMGYYYAAYHLLNLRLHPREGIRWLEISLKAARKLGDKTFQGYSFGNLGNAYAALGETRKAIKFHEQDLVIARKIGDRRGEGDALGNLGNAYAAKPRKAIEFHKKALMIDREIGNHRGEGDALGNLGNAYAALGETRKAIKFHEQYLAIALEIGDRRGEGNALGNLGIAYKNLGETRKAIKFYEQNLAIAREIGNRRGEGNALWNKAVAYKQLGERAKAIALAEEALKIHEQIESPHASNVRATLEEWKAESE